MQTRKRNGQFGHKSYMLKIIVLSLLALMVYGAYEMSSTKVLEYTFPDIVTVDKSSEMYKAKIEKLKDEVVAKLMKDEGERVGYKDGDIYPTFDPPKSLYEKCVKIGGVMKNECLSYGEFQMKIDTIKLWAKKLDGTVMTDKEARTLAEDTEKAKEFVKRVIFEIPGSIWKWSGAVNDKCWYDTHINFIRELES